MHPSRGDTSRSYDVVVVGAGNGGLAAAATTATHGLKTLLVERHNLPGGGATSFRRGRFEFEASLHELCDVGSEEEPGGVRTLLGGLGADIGWHIEKDAFRSIVAGPDGYDVTLPAGIDAFVAKTKHSPYSAPIGPTLERTPTSSTCYITR